METTNAFSTAKNVDLQRPYSQSKFKWFNKTTGVNTRLAQKEFHKRSLGNTGLKPAQGVV